MSDATITREDLQMLAETAERFAKTEIAPHLEAWEKAGELPRDLHRRAAELGLLGLGYPEALGGTPAPWSLRNVLAAVAAPLKFLAPVREEVLAFLGLPTASAK